MLDQPAPKVFISHATEDKERFVLAFATRLRSVGIEAWVDQWEIIPGDSLVQKIYEEGLKNAQAVIIVLSHTSINKPWVKDELDIGVVNKMKRSCKIIPVVIDDCEIPEVLRATLYQKIPDINNYDAEFSNIVNSVFGQYDKPPLGTPPAYIQSKIDLVPGLTKIDSLVLKTICEIAIEAGHFYLRPDYEARNIEGVQFDLDPSDLQESLSVLDERGLINGKSLRDNIIWLFTITTSGFGEYARVYIPDYDLIVRNVALRLVNHEEVESEAIGQAISQPSLIVEHAFDLFENRGWLKQFKLNGGGALVRIVAPGMKRWLREHD